MQLCSIQGQKNPCDNTCLDQKEAQKAKTGPSWPESNDPLGTEARNPLEALAAMQGQVMTILNDQTLQKNHIISLRKL